MAVFLYFAQRTEIILVRHLVHPHDVHAVERFLDSDVRHRRRRGGAVLVLVARRAPYDVACTDLYFRFALALRPTATCRDDQRLPQRMGVPCGARTRLERNSGRRRACRWRRAIEWINADSPDEILFRPFDRWL